MNDDSAEHSSSGDLLTLDSPERESSAESTPSIESTNTLDFAETEHSHEDDHVCGPNCEHNQSAAEKVADSAFAETEHSHEDDHVCGPNCEHNQSAAEKVADSAFAETEHSHEDDHVCGPNCEHNQSAAEKVADSAFAETESQQASQTPNEVIGSEVQESSDTGKDNAKESVSAPEQGSSSTESNSDSNESTSAIEGSGESENSNQSQSETTTSTESSSQPEKGSSTSDGGSAAEKNGSVDSDSGRSGAVGEGGQSPDVNSPGESVTQKNPIKQARSGNETSSLDSAGPAQSSENGPTSPVTEQAMPNSSEGPTEVSYQDSEQDQQPPISGENDIAELANESLPLDMFEDTEQEAGTVIESDAELTDINTELEDGITNPESEGSSQPDLETELSTEDSTFESELSPINHTESDASSATIETVAEHDDQSENAETQSEDLDSKEPNEAAINQKQESETNAEANVPSENNERTNALETEAATHESEPDNRAESELTKLANESIDDTAKKPEHLEKIVESVDNLIELAEPSEDTETSGTEVEKELSRLAKTLGIDKQRLLRVLKIENEDDLQLSRFQLEILVGLKTTLSAETSAEYTQRDIKYQDDAKGKQSKVKKIGQLLLVSLFATIG